jgi:hypothetical protein
MRVKRMSGGKRREEPNQPPTMGELMSELSATPNVGSAISSRTPRARRAGPFKVPASIAGPGNRDREEIARRFKQHLRGVSGANKLGPDPDETVPVVRPGQRRAMRPGVGFRPNPIMPSRFGRLSPVVRDDDEDE